MRGFEHKRTKETKRFWRGRPLIFQHLPKSKLHCFLRSLRSLMFKNPFCVGGCLFHGALAVTSFMVKAFILGAGLGTRLRPLTNQLPKPLIPVYHQPLIAYAMGHLRAAGVREFVVNTHHLPDAYLKVFPSESWEGCPITFRHEPVILETGGGLANVADLLEDAPFFLYNGDVLTDLPLQPVIDDHRAAGNLVTLVLRSTGAVQNVAFDRKSGQVLDLRNALKTNHADLFQFTGLYIVEPGFFRWLHARTTVEGVVAAWLRAITAGQRIGGVVVDDGQWFDLGDRASYLQSHLLLRDAGFPAWQSSGGQGMVSIHPTASIAPSARIDEISCIGAGAVVEDGVVIEGSVLWPGTRVEKGSHLRDCIVLTGATASGTLTAADIAPSVAQ